MIPERRMQELLESAAAEYQPPPHAAGRVLAALAPQQPVGADSGWRRPRRLIAVGVAALVLVTAGVAAVDRDGVDTTAAGGSGAARGGAPAAGVQTEAHGLGTTDEAATSESASGAPPAPQVDVTKIIKTGSIDIEVAAGRADHAVDRITTLAVGAGGYVSDTTASSTEDHDSAAVTIRIPAERFESVLQDIGRLGERRQTKVAGRDVTAEYTDIEARLRVLHTSRESLLQVLADARAVGDILAVHDRLNVVQTEIEQLEGRRRLLDDQVAFATLAVSISEPGEATASLGADSKPAWRKAVDGFTGTWAAVLAASGTALAIVLFAAGLLIIAVAAVRSGRRLYARLAA